MSREVREKWEVCFSQIGIDRRILFEMSNDEFNRNCDFIRESGLPCPPREEEPPHNSKRKPGRTDSGLIRDQQNEEYLRMQEQMKIKEKRKQIEQEQKKEQEAATQKSLEESKNDKINAAKQLGQEPNNGVELLIKLPSGKSIKRKFDQTHLCDELFTFVTGQEEMFDGFDSIPYELMTLNKKIEKGKTFQDYGIRGKTMINVMEIDEEEEDDE